MEYEYWFASIPTISERKKHLLRKKLGDGKCIFYIEETKLRELKFLNEKDIHTIMQAQKAEDIKEKYMKLEREKIRFIPSFSELFPEKLLLIPDPPYALYVKGKLPSETVKTVAIVGARQCTPYGETYAYEFGKKLAMNGVVIVSGMARGIDGMGQRGALVGKGMTVAVFGCGVDVCYPKEHGGLYRDILEHEGGLLSEFPPGTPPLSRHFPQRNRIISALSDVILVMEAKEKSGSLITADMALEQGKDIYALPGPVSSSLSQGCNLLIRQGAGILLSPEILLEDMGVPVTLISQKINKNKKVLESEENMVYSRLDLYPKNLTVLVEKTAMPANKLVECLVSLELKGYIREVSKNHYVKINEK